MMMIDIRALHCAICLYKAEVRQLFALRRVANSNSNLIIVMVIIMIIMIVVMIIASKDIHLINNSRDVTSVGEIQRSFLLSFE